MKKKIISLSGLIIIVLSVIFIFYFWKDQHDKVKGLTLYGNVDIRQVDLGFRVFGKVTDLLFDEGDEVLPGQLMATLDKIPYEETVNQAKAKVVSAGAAFHDAEEKLQKREVVAPSAISKETYDSALFNRNMAKGSFEEANAALESQLTDYKDTELYCPTKGTILSRIREPGSVVQPGEPIFTLSIESPIWIRAYVSEPNLGKIYPGMPAEITTDTKNTPIYKGHIGFISPVAEFTPKTVETLDLRTDLVYRLRIIVDNPDYKVLRQGMPVTVKLYPKNNDEKKS